MEKIAVRDLTFCYPTGTKPALSGISLSVPESEFVVLCGKSGCGKSTLLRHLKKSLTPYGEMSGQVLYEGEDLADLDLRRDAAEIGFVQQDPDHQIVTDKVWHELAFGLENLGLPTPVIRRRVAEMASYFGIHSWFRKDVSQLSGGQKQILNLASVMAMQPQILILDEPASQLDPIAASDLLNMIRRINRELGTTVIISEHRLEEVFPMADRVIVLEEGRILAEGTPQAVARKLASAGEDGQAHPMYFGMPTVMRVFPEEVLGEETLPLTIREGRLLLERLLKDRDLSSEEKKAADGTGKETGARGTAETENGTETAGTAPKKDGREIVFQAKKLHFRYEKGMEDVLRGLDLSIRKGEIYCLLGGNGSGKTTTLKVAAGVLKPQRGSLTRKAGMTSALVPQNPQALFTEITAEEEILEGMAYLPLTDKEKIGRVEKWLSLMEIEHLRKANPFDLSGGEQQRLAMAKIMAYGPELLLLDEPTKGLDPFFKRSLGELFRKLTGEGVTLFLVSHDIDFCAGYGDTCALFFDGEIIASGTNREFFSGNRYYTTTVNKLAGRWNSSLITCEEAREWLGRVL